MGVKVVLKRTVTGAVSMEAARTYWEGRGFDNWLPAGDVYTATRGSSWANFASFDSCKLSAQLKLVRVENGIEAEMEISTSMQLVTIWNYAKWQLELREFEIYLRTGQLDPETWRDYRRNQWRVYLDWRPAPALLRECLKRK
ncbi:MAG TPA: hypothetical protein VGE01_06455 [Fimbriimonas sp.]